ncbi:hypothetical protein Hdeb2414_s0004g00128691 [Helianthus debilis subsp. tardiflorus]
MIGIYFFFPKEDEFGIKVKVSYFTTYQVHVTVQLHFGRLRSTQLWFGSTSQHRSALIWVSLGLSSSAGLGAAWFNPSMACGFQILALKSYSLSSAIVSESDECAIVKENFDSVRHQKEKHSMFTSVLPLGSRRM